MKRLAPLALGLAAACGGSIDQPGAPDAARPPTRPADAMPPDPADARPPPADAATAECPAGLPSSFGNLGLVTSTKNNIGGSYNVFVYLDGDSRWFFAMNLYPERGIFADGVKPGRYDLMGADTDYQYCAACLSLFAEYPDGPPSLHMFAAKGTLEITSVSGDQVSGRLEDVLLTAIEIVYDDEGVPCSPNDDGTIDAPECVNTICLGGNCGRQVNLIGCDTSIDAMSF